MRVLLACTISQSAGYDFEQGEVPFNALPVDLVLGCASFGTARCGLGTGGRKRVCDHLVYRIFAII